MIKLDRVYLAGRARCRSRFSSGSETDRSSSDGQVAAWATTQQRKHAVSERDLAIRVRYDSGDASR